VADLQAMTSRLAMPKCTECDKPKVWICPTCGFHLAKVVYLPVHCKCGNDDWGAGLVDVPTWILFGDLVAWLISWLPIRPNQCCSCEARKRWLNSVGIWVWRATCFSCRHVRYFGHVVLQIARLDRRPSLRQ
jgi:hypothetical protein